ncbi:sensor histidine kinase [Nitrosophilus alvini]|uniref:sensor histidine kinase n=1 Tax=Nitrosophilus alvini TaxID=2714855 RepID=UPI001909A87C|nr:HAMP domain-containing sensor histidine kinase [Nitrosophilus alvini]
MKLKIDESKFSLRYSILYTLTVLAILLVPFAIYDNYTYNLEEVKTEMALKKKSIQIINEMEKFDSRFQSTFTFPRFKSYQAGLYDQNGNPIFTLIKKPISTLNLKPGYHKLGNYRYFVTEFRDGSYFGAKYLVVGTEFNIYTILYNIMIVFLSILAITFIFSFIILKNFSKPFKEINKALDDFIKDSMHEINTPLSIININIDMFTEKFGKNKYLSRIKSAAKILSSLYDDMNYLIKERTINRAEKKRINFSEFLKRSVDYFRDIAELKDISLHTDIQKDIYINFVPAKLQKIIDNNLSNAIKYSNEGGKVIVSLKKENNKIILGFKDYGIGIKDPAKIFSRYYREDNTKGGFGIGLNIVGKIANEEKIKVNIVSSLGKGSYFEYIFPAS